MKKKTVWIDIDNSPHVQIFENIIKALEPDFNVLVTAKDYNQTLGLLKLKGIKYELFGRHPGANIFKKVFGNIFRAVRLAIWATGKNIDISVCHGSRALIMASKLTGIRSVVMFDYEHSERFLKTKFGKYLLVPSYLGKDYLVAMGYPEAKLTEYPELKESIYLPFYKNDPSMKERLKLDMNKIIVLLRPPSEVSHYNANVSYDLFSDLFDRLSTDGRLQVIFIPRYDSQKEKYKKFIERENVILPKDVEEGLNLIYFSDLVISGGGTMNREAAAMKTPVYSIFQGKKPKIDETLEKEGRLTFITNKEDIGRIIYKKKGDVNIESDKNTFDFIVNFIKDHA
ncbi:MAG TPA: DUF354 domain-containing protein [Clostridiales bacterium]|nr:DUF354 domain-containing protein [Clostridiales bacterium]HQP69943.1 DUF354 domain-containing protein [Clostridiales bacterium]